jgi:hypothetical protein
MYKIIKSVNSPKILIITPLKSKDKISNKTLYSLSQNSISFDWITYEGNNSPIDNNNLALSNYKKSLPKYVINIDNDIIANDNWLDSMYNTLELYKEAKYTYTEFEFIGAIKHKFAIREFNEELLKKQNYISFCSLIRSECIKEFNGFITIPNID